MRTPIAILASIALLAALGASGPAAAEQDKNKGGKAPAAAPKGGSGSACTGQLCTNEVLKEVKRGKDGAKPATK